MKAECKGIFSWNSLERRINRYGYVSLFDSDFRGEAEEKVILNRKALLELDGKRVKMTAIVLKNRESGHIGDLFLGITPTTPEVGEVVELGVGCLHVDIKRNIGSDEVGIGLVPYDGREEFWLDPRKLYRLHDQSVTLVIETTTEEPHEAPTLEQLQSDGVVAVGDGSFQVKNVETPTTLKPKVERLGEGLFAMSFDYKKNERVE